MQSGSLNERRHFFIRIFCATEIDQFVVSLFSSLRSFVKQAFLIFLLLWSVCECFFVMLIGCSILINKCSRNFLSVFDVVCGFNFDESCIISLISLANLKSSNMKLLDNESLLRMSEALTGVHTHTNLVAQLESYSCKMAGADKRLYKQISNEGPTSELEILASPSAFEVHFLC